MLIKHGLIRVSSTQLRLEGEDDIETLQVLGRKYAVLRLARRTDLGQAVVDLYGDELRKGKRIRWLLQLNDALEVTLFACPHRQI
jgi:hypothetical protein